MKPSIEAAWIAAGSGFGGALVGVAGTAIVGLAGFRNTRKATDKTVKAAHADRVWDRKADAYQDALAESLWRKHHRGYIINVTTELTDDEYAQAAGALFKMQTERDWWSMQGRLGAFGHPRVIAAYDMSLQAAENARHRHDHWRVALQALQADRAGRGTTTSMGPDELAIRVAEARAALQAAVLDAQEADNLLEAEIHADLDGDSAEAQQHVAT